MIMARFEVYLTQLDPTVGAEMRKTRPCVVITPDSMNRSLRTVIIAPLTTGGIRSPSRIVTEFKGKAAQIALDQLRTVDKSRLLKKLGMLDAAAARAASNRLVEMFTY